MATVLGVASGATTWGSDPSKFNQSIFTLMSAMYLQLEALKVQNETQDGKLTALTTKLNSVEAQLATAETRLSNELFDVMWGIIRHITGVGAAMSNPQARELLYRPEADLQRVEFFDKLEVSTLNYLLLDGDRLDFRTQNIYANLKEITGGLGDAYGPLVEYSFVGEATSTTLVTFTL